MTEHKMIWSNVDAVEWFARQEISFGKNMDRYECCLYAENHIPKYWINYTIFKYYDQFAKAKNGQGGQNV